jgi:hypothetical protein
VRFVLAAGKSNGEIGTLPAISPRTVQKHLEHIFDKLGVETRTSAALCALSAIGDHVRLSATSSWVETRVCDEASGQCDFGRASLWRLLYWFGGRGRNV